MLFLIICGIAVGMLGSMSGAVFEHEEPENPCNEDIDRLADLSDPMNPHNREFWK